MGLRTDAYPGLGSPFSIIHFADAGDQDVVYLEGQAGADRILERPADVMLYSKIVDQLWGARLVAYEEHSPAGGARRKDRQDVASPRSSRRGLRAWFTLSEAGWGWEGRVESTPALGKIRSSRKARSPEKECLEVAHIGEWVLLRNSRFP